MDQWVSRMQKKAATVKDPSTYINLVKQPDKFVVPQIGGITVKVKSPESPRG